jgi:lipopolysaccharide export system permease protein
MKLYLFQRAMLRRLVINSVLLTVILAGATDLIIAQDGFKLLTQGIIRAGQFAVILLTLIPGVIYLTEPLIVATAVVYTYNEWITHNEIVILRMAGLPDQKLALPGMAVAVVAMLFTASMSLYLLPVSFRIFENIRFDATSNLSIDALVDALKQGYPQEIAPNLLISFRKYLGQNEFESVTILDGRKPDSFTYIFADHGSIVIKKEPKLEHVLLLENGTYTVRNRENDAPNLTTFKVLEVPIGDDAPPVLRAWRGFYEEHITRLLDPPSTVRADAFEYGQWVAEGHKRILMPLLCVSYVTFVIGILMYSPCRKGLRGNLPAIIALASVFLWHIIFVVTQILIAHLPILAPVFYLLPILPFAIGQFLLRARDRVARAPAQYIVTSS